MIPTVKVFDSFNEAYYAYEDYVTSYPELIVLKFKIRPVFELLLVDGTKLLFMSRETYEKWNTGKTYIRNGSIYHSGEIIKKAESEGS